jgi:hypothetical protein
MYTGISSHTRTIVRVLGALALLVNGSVHLGLLLLSPVPLRGKARAILDQVAAPDAP